MHAAQQPRLTAADLPRMLAVSDRRGRMVPLVQFAKDWAHTGSWAARDAMIRQPPRPHRRLLTIYRSRKTDLPRIAAIVHAICDRDGHPVPHWVLSHRSRTDVALSGPRPLGSSDWDAHLRSVAPQACAYHRVWFDPASIADYRVHGFQHDR